TTEGERPARTPRRRRTPGEAAAPATERRPRRVEERVGYTEPPDNYIDIPGVAAGEEGAAPRTRRRRRSTRAPAGEAAPIETAAPVEEPKRPAPRPRTRRAPATATNSRSTAVPAGRTTAERLGAGRDTSRFTSLAK